MIRHFVLRKVYDDLVEFCSREQGRAQVAEFQVQQLIADNETLGRLVMHYKKKAERLEHQQNHPRKDNGQYSRIIPITTVEFSR